VFNILLNAAQAMNGSGRIEVAAAPRGARVALAIRDEGPGIPEADLARVFEPFYTTKPAGAGTGLGLAISSEIVHELGGELRSENRPGGGACFVVDLPLARA
jgi:two-component system C4-dicarboxylate transport sensor histidine kinase DctB